MVHMCVCVCVCVCERERERGRGKRKKGCVRDMSFPKSSVYIFREVNGVQNWGELGLGSLKCQSLWVALLFVSLGVCVCVLEGLLTTFVVKLHSKWLRGLGPYRITFSSLGSGYHGYFLVLRHLLVKKHHRPLPSFLLEGWNVAQKLLASSCSREWLS